MTSKEELKKKIEKWLFDQGYPLEMRIASTLQQMGFRVVQSEYFTDPESGNSRELDIVAFKQKRIDDILFRVSLLIECKRSTDKPWLMFTSGDTSLASPARVAQRAGNSLARRFLLDAARQEEMQSLPIFQLPERSAYGVTQALTSGKDVCYSAVTSVSKAALATVAKLDERKEREKKEPRLRRGISMCSIVFPVVAVEGQLFEVYLGENSDIIVDSVENGILLWRNPLVGMPHTIVNIVSSNNIEQFSAETSQSIDRIFELTENELKEKFSRSVERDRSPMFHIG